MKCNQIINRIENVLSFLFHSEWGLIVCSFHSFEFSFFFFFFCHIFVVFLFQMLHVKRSKKSSRKKKNSTNTHIEKFLCNTEMNCKMHHRLLLHSVFFSFFSFPSFFFFSFLDIFFFFFILFSDVSLE